MENLVAEFDLGQENYNVLYNIAVQKSMIGDHEQAITILKFLVINAIDERGKYMKALAGCFHHQSELSGAIHFYLMSYFIDPVLNVDCLLYTADCLMKQNRFHEVVDTLDILFTATANQDDAKFIAKAKMLHRIATNKIQSFSGI